ncbi:hypothetical protein ACQKD0_09840 [Vreelandella aquamarina]|uniref:hypothetical protein n=1 Tax=Vreelandella aquamarina TaxID=77097 RepID=UPI0006D0D82E
MSSKLYSLKEWLTLDDAASHLTAVLAEKVSVTDILQLAIQKRIKLSVNLLSGAYANKGTIKDICEAHVILSPAGTPLSWLRGDPPSSPLEKQLRSMGQIKVGEIKNLDEDIKRAVAERRVEMVHIGNSISETEIVEFEKGVQMLTGIYDLPMLSAEQSLVEELYYPEVGGPNIEPWGLEGIWLEKDGYIYRLCERSATQADYDACGTESSIAEWEKRYNDPSRWFPTERIPTEYAIILRRKNLDDFLTSIEGPNQAQGLKPDKGEQRILEAFGLLVELYTSQHGPDYRHGKKPKASRIVEDMLNAIPEDVTNMGDRKLKEYVGSAIKAWEAKKHR